MLERIEQAKGSSRASRRFGAWRQSAFYSPASDHIQMSPPAILDIAAARERSGRLRVPVYEGS